MASWLRGVAVVGLLLGLTGSASALGHGRPATTSASYYYYPQSAYYYYVPSFPVFQPPVVGVPLVPEMPYCPPTAGPMPLAPQRIYANPSPAPPSPGPMPPASSPPTSNPPGAATPGVRESASGYSGAIPRAAVADRCAVRFWNRTAQELTIKVQGQTHAIPAGRSLTVELPHRFVWQLDDRAAQSEDLALAQTTFDVVIRR